MSKGNQRTPQAARKQSRGGTLIGLFIGLVIGLVCAFGVAWYLQKAPLPFLDKTHAERNETTPAVPPLVVGSPGAPVALPGKPGEKPMNAANAANDKPRFDFYKILPGEQGAAASVPKTGDPQPAAHADQPPATETTAAPPVAVSESFFLQAGAFQKPVDADNLKAKLALMGLETTVLEANVPDKGVMYRVRVGPFAKPDEMNRARNQLSQNGIQASLIKIKDKPVQ